MFEKKVVKYHSEKIDEKKWCEIFKHDIIVIYWGLKLGQKSLNLQKDTTDGFRNILNGAL
jgi:hypothetical protein